MNSAECFSQKMCWSSRAKICSIVKINEGNRPKAVTNLLGTAFLYKPKMGVYKLKP